MRIRAWPARPSGQRGGPNWLATLRAIRLNVSGKIFGSGPTCTIVSTPEASVLSTTSQTLLGLVDPAVQDLAAVEVVVIGPSSDAGEDRRNRRAKAARHLFH